MATVKKPGKKDEAGAVKPWDQVEFKWSKPQFATKKSTSMIHRSLADKMAAAGKGEIVKAGKTDLREKGSDGENI